MQPRWLELRDADDDAWSVYADELQAAGDVRGELIRLQLDRKSGRVTSRERELLSNHETLTGPRGTLDGLDATWRRGFISIARAPTLKVLPVLLEHRSGALLDELLLDNPHAPLSELVDLVARKGHQLRVLTVRTENGPTSFDGDIRLGRVLSLTGLRRVSALVRTLDLSSGALPAVSLVELLDLAARAVSLVQLDGWTFPRLRRLELTAFSHTWRSRVLLLPPRLLAGEVAPELEELVLSGYAVLGLGRVRDCIDVHPRLKLLDLSGCEVQGELYALRGARCEVRLPQSG